MNRMDFTYLFYDQVRGRDSLFAGLDALQGTEPHKLTMVPYGSDCAPSECFKSDARNRSFELVRDSGEVWLFKLLFKPAKGSGNEDALEGSFFVSAHPTLSKVFLVTTIEPVDFVRRALMPFIRRKRAQIYLTFVKHDDLRRLLQEFRRNNAYTDLRVVRASSVSRFGAEKGEAMIPSVSWPGLGLEQAFLYAEEQNGWFRSLTFEALKDSRVLGETTVYRNGVTKTDGGFSGVYRGLISPICELVGSNLELFAKRGRRENPHLAVRPLTIEFPKEQFSKVEENARFISAVRKLDNASISVIHGNPYIALSVVDYTDGSTFDLWVLNPREVVIVPQLKSTVLGIKRLISCVFDNYAEGLIREFSAAGAV
ncbi:MAG: hypothetical protein HY671_01675 [Chloroflexi bacterium]|nr:hypothetical protein [Chloroflexota bacterium]